MTLTEFKDAAQAAQSVVTTIAIAAGAIWFFFRRVRFPCATITHSVVHRPIREGKTLLRVSIHAVNAGVVLLKPESIAVWIHQVCPLHPDLKAGVVVRDLQSECDWPIIAERTHHLRDHEIEPGEPDEFHFDFELDADVKTILAYTYVKNIAKKKRWPSAKSREIGWRTTTIYDLHNEHSVEAA